MPAFPGLSVTAAPAHGDIAPHVVYCSLVGINGFVPVDATWDFGDGSPVASGLTPSHTYTSVGAFTISCTATNASAASVTDTFDVTVGVAMDMAGQVLAYNALRGQAPLTLTVNFTVNTSFTGNVNWGLITPEQFLNFASHYETLLPRYTPWTRVIPAAGIYYLIANVGGDFSLSTTIYVGADEPVVVPPVLPVRQVSVDAIRARGTSSHPVSLRYSGGVLGLWDHSTDAAVDLTAPPEGITIWRELPFEELPVKAQEYVRVSSRIAYNREHGSGGSYMSQLQSEAKRLFQELMHEHTSTLRSNVGNRASLQRKLTDIRTGGLASSPRVPIR